MNKNVTGSGSQGRTRLAHVLKNQMEKTVVVGLTRTFFHPVYKKVMRRTSRIKAHDEKNECRIGDRVRIQVSRPISKDKHWRVIEIVERSKGEGASAGSAESAAGSLEASS